MDRWQLFSTISTFVVFLGSTNVGGVVRFELYRNTNFRPLSACSWIRNRTWSNPISFQSCVWECVYEHDCQTTLFDRTTSVCILFADHSSDGIIETFENISTTMISLRKAHSLRSLCLTDSMSTDVVESITMNSVRNTEFESTQSNDPFTISTTRKISENLLRNAGGEYGNLSFWQQTGSSTAIIDSNAAFLTGYYPIKGRYCFAGGSGSGGSSSALTQVVNLLQGIQNFTAYELDSNNYLVNISFYGRGYYFLSSWDTVNITVDFKDVTSRSIKSYTLNHMSCSSYPGQWCFSSSLKPLPNGTRFIDYTMKFIRGSGTRIISFVDDNLLKLV